MDIKQKEEIRFSLQAFIDSREDLSQTKIAKAMDVSAATVSHLLQGAWQHLSEQMLNRFSAFLRTKTGRWPVLTTYNLTAVRNLCEDTRELGRMVCICAPTGLGKSESLQTYARNEETFYLLVKGTMGKRHFLDALAKAMYITVSGDTHQMMSSIVGHLQTMGAPLLILDDVSKLSDKVLLLIQDLYDYVAGHTGIVLAGVPQLRTRILNGAAAERLSFAEFHSRIGYWLKLNRPTIGEVKGFCERYEITADEAVKMVHRLATDFRMLRSILENAQRATARGVNMNDPVKVASLQVSDFNYTAA